MNKDIIYRYETRDNYHQWAAIRSDYTAGVHIWCLDDGDRPDGRTYGGVEIHTTPKGGEQESHKVCHLLLGPCVHDGSSMQFDQYIEAAKHAIRTGDHRLMLHCAGRELAGRLAE